MLTLDMTNRQQLALIQTEDKQGIKQRDNIDNALIEQQLGNEEQELALAGTAEESIGPGRDRTFDQWIMSPLLYR